MNTRVKTVLKTTFVILAIAFIVMQFFHPPRNNSGEKSHEFSTVLPMSDSVREILRVACYDCHSNTTRYPWYSTIQPVDWWLSDHIEEGRGDLNFDAFGTYRVFRQFRRMQQIDTMVMNDEMPLASYTLIHRDAILNADQKDIIHRWAAASIDSLKRRYPPDSLRRPERKNQ